jgi:hypothetical protein
MSGGIRIKGREFRRYDSRAMQTTRHTVREEREMRAMVVLRG